MEKYKLEDKEWQTVREVADGVMTSVSDYVITTLGCSSLCQMTVEQIWGYIVCMQG